LQRLELQMAALKQQMLHRIASEAPSIIASLELAPEARASMRAESPLGQSLQLLGFLAGRAVNATEMSWQHILNLVLQLGAENFGAQFVDFRMGVSATVTDAPSLQASFFTRKGIELDCDFSTSLNLRLPPNSASGGQRTADPHPPPQPPPRPPGSSLTAEQQAIADSLYHGKSQIALSLPAGEVLPAAQLALALNLLRVLLSFAGSHAAELQGLITQLETTFQLNQNLLFLFVVAVDVITGQLALNIPITYKKLAAALAQPTLNPLLESSVSFSVSPLVAVALIFSVGRNPIVTTLDSNQAPPALKAPSAARPLGRRMLQAAAALPDGEQAFSSEAFTQLSSMTPAAFLQLVRAFVAASGGSVVDDELIATASLQAFKTIGASLWTGVLERESLRARALVRKDRIKKGLVADAEALAAGKLPPFLGQGSLLKVLETVVAATAFASIGITLSANEAVTLQLHRAQPEGDAAPPVLRTQGQVGGGAGAAGGGG
jgi:hypothetical protein